MDESNNRATVPTADLEQVTGMPPMAKDENPSFDSPVTIRVISYRKREHDTDGISAKAVIDGLVGIGILADDSTKQVKSVTFESRKTEKGEKEKTIIEIDDNLGE